MNLILFLIISLVIGFAFTFWLMPLYMKFVFRVGVTGIDQQKKGKPLLPTSGGVPVFLGLFASILVFILLSTFSSENPFSFEVIKRNMLLLGGLLSIAIFTSVGFFDDVYVQRYEKLMRSDTKERRIGLRQWQKPLLTLLGGVPLIVLMAGTSVMDFPVLGRIDIGLIYPLILIPLAVVTVSNATNMLAGLNGLEAGLMIIASFTLGLFSLSIGRIEGPVIAFSLTATLLAFFVFNKYPSKILPGDSLTYFAGGAFVTAVILGNVEKLGILIFIPWILEAFLKLRARFKARSFGDLQKDGTLKAPYEKIFSLTHIVMKLPEWLGRKRFTERQAVIVLLLFEILVCIIALLIYNRVLIDAVFFKILI